MAGSSKTTQFNYWAKGAVLGLLFLALFGLLGYGTRQAVAAKPWAKLLKKATGGATNPATKGAISVDNLPVFDNNTARDEAMKKALSEGSPTYEFKSELPPPPILGQ